MVSPSRISTPTSLQPRKYTIHPALLGTDWQGNQRGSTKQPTQSFPTSCLPFLSLFSRRMSIAAIVPVIPAVAAARPDGPATAWLLLRYLIHGLEYSAAGDRHGCYRLAGTCRLAGTFDSSNAAMVRSVSGNAPARRDSCHHAARSLSWRRSPSCRHRTRAVH